MTDRYNSLIVALERDIREDDAKQLIKAIGMMKGVRGVTGNVVDPASYTAHLRIAHDITDKLYAMIKELNSL